MPKKHFKYNPDTLEYDKVEASWQIVVLKLFGVLSLVAIISIISIYTYRHFTNSPNSTELVIISEKNDLTISSLKGKLELIDKELEFVREQNDNIYRQIFEAPLPEGLSFQGIGGTKRYSTIENLTMGTAVIELQTQVDATLRRAKFQQKSFEEIMLLAKKRSKDLASVPAIQPIANKQLSRMASGYGYRIDPFYGTRKFHAGMDFTCKRGTEVHVTGDGVIEKIETKRWGYGKNIIVNHGNGYKTRYAHLYKFKCRVGQKVKRGETIGLAGSSGKSTAPHLHYEVVKDGVKVNPAHYYYDDLSPEEYEVLIKLSSLPNKSLD